MTQYIQKIANEVLLQINNDFLSSPKKEKLNIVLQVDDEHLKIGVDLTKDLSFVYHNCALIADSSSTGCCPDWIAAYKYAADYLILITSSQCEHNDKKPIHPSNLPKCKVIKINPDLKEYNNQQDTNDGDDSSIHEDIVSKAYVRITKAQNLIESCLDNPMQCTVGIVTTHTASPEHLDQRDRLLQVCRKKKVRSISIFCAQIRPEKLENFVSVKFWVIVSCPKNLKVTQSLQRDYRVPMLTPWEFEVASGCREFNTEPLYTPTLTGFTMAEDNIENINNEASDEFEQKKNNKQLTYEECLTVAVNSCWDVSMPPILIPDVDTKEDLYVHYGDDKLPPSIVEKGLEGIASNYDIKEKKDSS